MSESKDKRWIKLGELSPNFCYASVVKVNENQFLAASTYLHDREEWPGNGILKYDVHKNEWTRFMKYPNDTSVVQHNLAINVATNKLYLTTSHAPMTIIDTKTHKFDVNKLQNKTYDIIPNDNWHGALLNVNGTIHFIGGSQNSKHLIWNDEQNCFEEIYDFKTTHAINRINDAEIVYVKSKQMIFLIGGMCGRKFDAPSNKKYMGIWTYCLTKNKWQKIEYLRFDNWSASAIVTCNEQFIVIFGRWDDDRYLKNDMIYVLDIRDDNKYKLSKSSVRFPRIVTCKIIRRGGLIRDEMLVIGWIKCLFKLSEYKCLRLPPTYIMQLISIWYSQEEIHWLEDDYQGNQHFVINVKHIISSTMYKQTKY